MAGHHVVRALGHALGLTATPPAVAAWIVTATQVGSYTTALLMLRDVCSCQTDFFWFFALASLPMYGAALLAVLRWPRWGRPVTAVYMLLHAVFYVLTWIGQRQAYTRMMTTEGPGTSDDYHFISSYSPLTAAAIALAAWWAAGWIAGMLAGRAGQPEPVPA